MKDAWKAELLAALTAALDDARRAYAAAIEGATHEEARAENDKDTRGLEQSYLARGQAQRVEELAAAVAEIEKWAVRDYRAGDAIGLGALVTVDEAGASLRLWLAPQGGGVVLAGGVQVVTPRSPLGRALVGRRVDDEVDVALPGRVRSLTVAAIE